MKRARLVIAEVTITKQGEMQHFQMKLPKNTRRIIAVETDIVMNTPLADRKEMIEPIALPRELVK